MPVLEEIFEEIDEAAGLVSIDDPAAAPKFAMVILSATDRNGIREEVLELRALAAQVIEDKNSVASRMTLTLLIAKAADTAKHLSLKLSQHPKLQHLADSAVEKSRLLPLVAEAYGSAPPSTDPIAPGSSLGISSGEPTWFVQSLPENGAIRAILLADASSFSRQLRMSVRRKNFGLGLLSAPNKVPFWVIEGPFFGIEVVPTDPSRWRCDTEQLPFDLVLADLQGRVDVSRRVRLPGTFKKAMETSARRWQGNSPTDEQIQEGFSLLVKKYKSKRNVFRSCRFRWQRPAT